jgi:hypothetical protein
MTIEPVPAWVQGVWRRNTLRVESGVIDDTTQVYWIQTPTLFADIRIPANRPDAAGKTSLADYDGDELLQLADQAGFAGSLRVDGQICRWQRPIDYQPVQPSPDEGAMFREGNTLTETGLHANYFEDYTLVDDGGGRFLALDCPEDGRLLVVAGSRFLFTRGRALELPDGAALSDLVDEADPARKRALLDCEFSLGHGLDDDDPWQIELSTLPFREGQPLFAASSWRFELDDGQAVEATGVNMRVWTVHTCTLDRHELSRRFPSGRQRPPLTS